MTTATSLRPAPNEHAEYYGRYIKLVPDGDVVARMERQIADTVALLDRFGEARAGHRYAPDKWSVREVVGHLADAERMFAYRGLAFARGEKQPLPGFDENAYTVAGRFDARTLADMSAEFQRVRAATVALFRGFDDTAWNGSGVANKNPISVRAIAWIIAGHELHHVALFRERYL